MKKFFYTFVCAIFSVILYSCDLELQTNEDYKGTSLDIYQHMTCWEYMEQHADEFSSMMKAVELCGMKEYYTQMDTRYTYLLLNETAIADKVKEVEQDPSLLISLQDILKFHIIKGEYHAYGTLDYNIKYVDTLLGGDAEMSLSLDYGEPHAADRNDVDRLVVMKGCGSSEVVTALESNLIMDNGPAHILDKICVYQD